MTGPIIQKFAWKSGVIEVTFSESVTVKGKPLLALGAGAFAGYVSGSGSDTLIFSALARAQGRVEHLDLNGGAILATAAAATQRVADVALP